MPACRQVLLSLLAVSTLSACRTTTEAAGVKDAEAPAALDPEETPLPPYEPRTLSVPVTDLKVFDMPVTKIEPKADGMALAGSTARYFFTIYGWQGTGPFNLPRYSHTWGVFIRVDGNDLSTSPLSAFTISWDAADGTIGLFMPVEDGHNYTLQETFDLAALFNVPIAIRRSPIFEIKKPLFDSIYNRYVRLTNGEANGTIRYKMIDDVGGRKLILANQNNGYTNCTHAITDTLQGPNGAILQTGAARGFAASDKVTQWFLNAGQSIHPPENVNSVLGSRLGI